MYEPCGLTQLIAAKYATVPIVRRDRGLCDTVFDHHHAGRPPHERNGNVFHQVDNMALESAMARAIGLWHAYPWQFRQLMTNGMRATTRGAGRAPLPERLRLPPAQVAAARRPCRL